MKHSKRHTYVTQDRTVDDIIQTHATTLEDVFDIKLQQKEKSLPQIYWIPKLHKTCLLYTSDAADE